MCIHPNIAFGLAGFPFVQQTNASSVLKHLDLTHLPNKRHALTGDGFPFELSFTTADDDLRWTCELASAGTASQRLCQTINTYKNLGGTTVEPDSSPNRFGAWLGGRHSFEGNSGYKLYIEPEDTPLDPSTPLPKGNVVGFRPDLQMIGIGPEIGRREYYYRFQTGSSYLLRELSKLAGLSHRAETLLQLIGNETPNDLERTLSRMPIGISFAYASQSSVPQLTVLFFARVLWGGDASIRKTFADKLIAAGRDPAAYMAATHPILDHNCALTWHGMSAVTITDTQHFWSVGLRPVQHVKLDTEKRI